MFIGVLAYASLVLNSLIYFLYGGEGDLWLRRMVVAGGAILGCGASLLWTSQGRLILQYASKAEELIDDSMPNESRSQTGRLMGLFWSIFQCSAIVGGALSFLYFNQKPKGSAALYLLFLAFILIGAMFTQFLLPPSMLKGSGTAVSRNHTKPVSCTLLSEQTPLFANVDSGYTDEQVTMDRDTVELSNQTWTEEARSTFRLFMTKRMGYLLLLFFYTVSGWLFRFILCFLSNLLMYCHIMLPSLQGFNQPYQQATFGNRFFTKRTIGAELIIFHLMEIFGALAVGRFLDYDKVHSVYPNSKILCKRTRAKICLGSFFVINSIGNILAASQEYEAKIAHIIAHDISSTTVLPPSMTFACWGFADAQIQVYSYWLIGGFYDTGYDHARAVGFYKLVQSLGTAIGYYLIPVSRLLEMSQLALSSFVFVAGTGLAFTQLPFD